MSVCVLDLVASVIWFFAENSVLKYWTARGMKEMSASYPLREYLQYSLRPNLIINVLKDFSIEVG